MAERCRLILEALPMNKFYLIIVTSFFLLSCNGEKHKLLETFKQTEQIIKSGSAKEIYDNLDQKSKDYVDFVTDSNNQDYLTMKQFGESVDYPLFTTIFHKSYSEEMLAGKNNMQAFMLYLKFSQIPVFSSFQETKLMEDETKVGKENYVTVGLKVGKNTFVTSKVKFTKEGDSYKFNLLGMLNFSERMYNQQFKKYMQNYGLEKVKGSKYTYKSGKKIVYPDDMLLSFLENMHKPEHAINELQYRK